MEIANHLQTHGYILCLLVANSTLYSTFDCQQVDKVPRVSIAKSSWSWRLPSYARKHLVNNTHLRGNDCKFLLVSVQIETLFSCQSLYNIGDEDRKREKIAIISLIAFFL